MNVGLDTGPVHHPSCLRNLGSGSVFLHIMSIALGGCIRPEPVAYGITEDTGGHITYILGEMRALAGRPDVDCAEIVTRLFDEPLLGRDHAIARQEVSPGCIITRIDSGNRSYLAKERLQADRAGFVRALIAELRSRERLPDLIHAHFADAADVAAQIEAELDIPYIYTAHSLGMDKLAAAGTADDSLTARIAEEDRAIAGASAIIGSSRDECERQLLGYPSARIERIHRVIPGITRKSVADLEPARQLIVPFLRDPGKPIVLAIARAVHKKNLVSLVEAFGSRKNLREKANLVILAGQRVSCDTGEPEQCEVIAGMLEAIDHHDLYGHVAYPKSHDSEAVAALYRLAARSKGVFVNPALVEPYGLTILEAAAFGLPVVATKHGGPVDTVGEIEHGILIDPNSPEEIADAIGKILGDEAVWQRFSRNGIENSASIDWDSYAANFVKIARSILAPKTDAAPKPVIQPSKLFVSDLDNTLTGCAQGVSRLREFLRARRDFAFVIATGRSIVEARRIVREWDIPEPAAWITSVGTEIFWSSTSGPVRDSSFPSLARVRWNPEAVEDVMERFRSLTPQPIYEQREFKRSYFYDAPIDIGTIRAALREAGLPVAVIASHGRLLDVLPASAGKAAASVHVAAALGIDPANVFAAGDSGNDEDMLIACENAIIVRNHSREIEALTERPNVYLSRHPHAAGAIEGIEAHVMRRREIAV